MNRFCVLLLVALVGCRSHDLRGSYKSSPDGKTYLAVVDDNGGHCGPIRVDGKLWLHKIGETAPVEPGRHTISCGGEIAFNIPKGVVYRFDYWGP